MPVFSTLKCFNHHLKLEAHVGGSVCMLNSHVNSWWQDFLLSKKFYSCTLRKQVRAGHFLALTYDITEPNDMICILVWDYRWYRSYIDRTISWHLYAISQSSVLTVQPLYNSTSLPSYDLHHRYCFLCKVCAETKVTNMKSWLSDVFSVGIWHSEDRASWYILIIKPCIVIYSYNKTNKMHYFSNLFLE
jgi:hypothetical protein